ncbi:MAG: 16S rRNA (guanine(966)-N(2))-methyltransferase RsmD [Spirochaetaceae bacterium]|jgi:16S rRNA (guanine966-N2)-methyltransferase|nr:16S rRNA (guanine(966)-N(2))-methyltransferase RsmD [Spirochaetaceae bacterium]
MRITGGIYRGRTIKCPPGIIRPAMERMRESMFSILGNISDIDFLDVFSGSGCIALEAASRGAKRIVLVEKDFKKKKTIMENLSMAECSNQLFMQPAERYFKQQVEQFDIIHLDPPFPLKNKEKFILSVWENHQLKEDGILMIHYPSEDKLEENIAGFQRYDLRKYGRSHLAFYRVKD